MQEGSVFTRVCLFTGKRAGGPHVSINHGALDLIIQTPPACPMDIRHETPWPQSRHATWPPASAPLPRTSDMGLSHPGPAPSPASDMLWPLLETCSNLFTLGSHPQHLGAETQMVDKRGMYPIQWQI